MRPSPPARRGGHYRGAAMRGSWNGGRGKEEKWTTTKSVQMRRSYNLDVGDWAGGGGRGREGKASNARWPGLLFGGHLACLVVLSQSVHLGTQQTGYISSGSRNSLREKHDLISKKKPQLLLAINSVTSRFGSSLALNVHFQILELLLVL